MPYSLIKKKSLKNSHKKRLKSIINILDRIKLRRNAKIRDKKNKAIFNNIIEYALNTYYLNGDLLLIADLASFLGRHIQDDLIMWLINKSKLSSCEYNESPLYDTFWFNFNRSFEMGEIIYGNSNFFSLCITDKTETYNIPINKVIYFTQPWSKSKLASCLQNIGERKKDRAWSSSALMSTGNTPIFHLPTRIISWQGGGTHSSATNIIRNLGTVKTNYVDIKFLLNV